MAENNIRTSIGVRLLIIAGLTIILFILMIMGLIKEREFTRDNALKEVSSKWGNQQTVAGPVLTVPYMFEMKTNENKIVTITKYAHLLPDHLSINSKLLPEIRYRGIYEVVLYRTDIQIEGDFLLLELKDLGINDNDVIWKDAFVTIGISDMRGINDMIELEWNEKKYTANSGVYSNDVITSGVSIKISLISGKDKYNFSTKINLNGSDRLMFLPVGKTTNVTVRSDWSDPSFTGYYLPDNRKIKSDGFTADWEINHLNRNYPQCWIGNKHKIDFSAFGIELLFPVDQYQKTMRTVKYAIMFISLTFLAFFMIELLGKKNIHPVQYMLIGFALLIFYSLLLSLSEHINFTFAYLISGIAIIFIITSYTKSVLRDNRQTGIIACILVILYTYLFVVLQLQDYALLIGTMGLLIALALVMYLTRKIDWFSVLNSKTDKT